MKKNFKAPPPKQALFRTAKHVESGEFVALLAWEETGNSFRIRFVNGKEAIVNGEELVNFVL